MFASSAKPAEAEEQLGQEWLSHSCGVGGFFVGFSSFNFFKYGQHGFVRLFFHRGMHMRQRAVTVEVFSARSPACPRGALGAGGEAPRCRGDSPRNREAELPPQRKTRAGSAGHSPVCALGPAWARSWLLPATGRANCCWSLGRSRSGSSSGCRSPRAPSGRAAPGAAGGSAPNTRCYRTALPLSQEETGLKTSTLHKELPISPCWFWKLPFASQGKTAVASPPSPAEAQSHPPRRSLRDPAALKAWTTFQHKSSSPSRISCSPSLALAANGAHSSLFRCKPPLLGGVRQKPSPGGGAQPEPPGYKTATKTPPPAKPAEK